jgi:hypothetical protein
MIVQKFYPRYSDASPVTPGDEVEVFYPDLHGIPHRGLVYRLIGQEPFGVVTIDIIHNSKRGDGVSVVSWEEFAQGQPVRRRRRPASPEHTRQILALAESTTGHPYSWNAANCEHFTDWCYNGGTHSQSETLQAGFVVAGVLAFGLAALARDPT